MRVITRSKARLAATSRLSMAANRCEMLGSERAWVVALEALDLSSWRSKGMTQVYPQRSDDSSWRYPHRIVAAEND